MSARVTILTAVRRASGLTSAPCATTAAPPSHKLRWRRTSPFSSCPITFPVRSHQTPTHPHWNHNPRSHLVPSGSPWRQDSAIGFCKRETSMVCILRGGKDTGTPTFSSSTGSELRSPAQPRSPASPHRLATTTLCCAGGQERPSRDLHSPSRRHPHRKLLPALFILSSSCPSGVNIYLQGRIT